MSVVTHGVRDGFSLVGPNRRPVSAPLSSKATLWFWALWTFIGLVSMFDAYLVHRFIDSIVEMEENPVCRFLITLDTENLSVFLPAKALGTLLVLSILRLIFLRRREYSLTITSAVAAYQAGLMLYLVV